MKIYTITFHWATNYGAVLQAYALQHYLEMKGNEVKIINYVPRKLKNTFLNSILCNPKRYKSNFAELKKERLIQAFRKKHLCLTKLYSTHKSLQDESWDEGLYVCGSDQIWNSFFTMRGEGGITLSYYLDFIPSHLKKISYAASFGSIVLDSPMDAIVAKELKTFTKVSVRERSAVEMLDALGIPAGLVCDPIFLLTKDEWQKMYTPSQTKTKRVFKYFLHQKTIESEKIFQYIADAFDCVFEGKNILSVEEWLRSIQEAEIVVTNSFHAVAFSVMFHTPFIAIVEKGNGMNDRLTTLLGAVGLLGRIVDTFDEDKLSEIISSSIDWELVDVKKSELKETSELFLRPFCVRD